MLHSDIRPDVKEVHFKAQFIEVFCSFIQACVAIEASLLAWLLFLVLDLLWSPDRIWTWIMMPITHCLSQGIDLTDLIFP
jgi:hypothetical protein